MLPAFDPWLSGTYAADAAAAARGDAAALAARRERRLAALLAAAARGSAFYRQAMGGGDPRHVRLSDMPPVHKAELMRRFDDWVCDPRIEIDALRRFVADPARVAEPYLGRYVVWESSGSLGEPGLFVQDAAAMAVYDALEAMRKPMLRPPASWFDPFGAAPRIVFVGATGGHFASNVSVERLRRLNPMVAQVLRCVSFLQPLPQLAGQLEAMAPRVLATYPSSAVVLAEEQAAGRLRLGLQEVWTGGEDLSAPMREFVERCFGCPVVNSYGASEFLALATDCRHRRLHLNSDWVILESVDHHGHAVAPGQEGATTLLTNLANHVQPLIRYDLGDRVTYRAGPCECGSPLPAIEVHGRSDDTLRLARPGGGEVRIVPLALTTVLEDDAGLFDFQLVQRGPRELELTTGQGGVAAHEAMRGGRDALIAFLARQGAPGVRIECRCDCPGRHGRSGKVQRVVALHA
jgi:phenylacetate-coenzyme A ligase PaaK-like adenylate-forming protein